MMETVKTCPVCMGTNFINYLEINDFSISGEVFKIQKCSQCNFLITNPRPDETDIVKYYESADYISHSNKSGSIMDRIYKIVRNKNISVKHKLIREFSDGNSILDYGCGTGEFIHFMKNKGFSIYGVEPATIARKQAESLNAVTIADHIDRIATNEISIITLWHVMEHIHQLRETIEKLRNLQDKNGILIIAVPNHNSLDNKIYGKYWAAWDVPRHLYHFSSDVMIRLIESFGYHYLATRPMKFDAYYVSLLSEKYKGNKNPINAFLNGLKSNIKARKTGEHSSKIYIFKR